MELTNLVKDTKVYHNRRDRNYDQSSLLVAELTNNLSIAYEKGVEQFARVGEGGRLEIIPGSEKKYIKYTTFPTLSYSLPPARYLENDEKAKFLEWVEEEIKRPTLASLGPNKTETEIYQHIIRPLEITESRERDWKPVGLFVGGTIAWPISVPITLAYSLISQDSNSGSLFLAALAAPLCLPLAVKEVFVPSKRFNKVTTAEILRSEPEKNRAAIFFNKHGKNNPKHFSGLPELVFNDGLWLTQYGTSKYEHLLSLHLEQYQQAACFIDVEVGLKEKVEQSINAENSSQGATWEEWRNFKPTKEEHTALLKQVGFLEE